MKRFNRLVSPLNFRTSFTSSRLILGEEPIAGLSVGEEGTPTITGNCAGFFSKRHKSNNYQVLFLLPLITFTVKPLMLLSPLYAHYQNRRFMIMVRIVVIVLIMVMKMVVVVVMVGTDNDS